MMAETPTSAIRTATFPRPSVVTRSVSDMAHRASTSPIGAPTDPSALNGTTHAATQIGVDGSRTATHASRSSATDLLFDAKYPMNTNVT